MKKCNGTGLVLKICETKNNVWKKYRLSIQNSIDNHIKITYIKPNFASLSDVKIAGNLINQGFPFCVLAKCLQKMETWFTKKILWEYICTFMFESGFIINAINYWGIIFTLIFNQCNIIDSFQGISNLFSCLICNGR